MSVFSAKRLLLVVVPGPKISFSSAFATPLVTSIKAIAQIMFEVNTSTTATENIDIIVPLTVNASTYESNGEAQRLIIEYDNAESDNPANRSITMAGVFGFTIKARLRDTDDTAGGDDSAKGTTLDVDIVKDNVNI